MPPKRKFDDDEDERTTTEEESTDEDTDDSEASTTPKRRVQAADTSAGGQAMSNNPHDLAFNVEDDGEQKTPPEGSLHGSGGTMTGGAGAGPATAGAPRDGGNTLTNNPHDAAFEVENARDVPTPQTGGAEAATGRVGPTDTAASASASNKIIKNDKHDEFSDVEDDVDDDAATPPRSSQPNRGTGATGAAASASVNSNVTNNTSMKQSAINGGTLRSNDHHDEEIEVDGSSAATTPERNPANNTATARQPQHTPANAATSKAANGQMRPDDDDDEDSSDVETSEDEDGNTSGGAPVMGAIEAAAQQQGGPSLEYNPKDYEYLRKKVPAEVLDIFNLIEGFQATEMDLPARFRPFVPDFIPCVGDIDAFCKVPRPDGLPDGFGLHVIDEPSTYQSNPAIVKIGLETLIKGVNRSVHVQSIEDALNRPGLIDRWVSEIRETHAKKPLPTVNYSKPMPEIEELLQVWPTEFEEILSSDLQFPPPQIDLDIEQYCRVMCTMLDIPIYDNIIESIHVMFTLFLEFRANQHFQHN